LAVHGPLPFLAPICSGSALVPRALAGRSLSVNVVRHGGPANTRSSGFTCRPSPR